jgi:thiol-disulfide isomerase/thioredoxin
LPAAEKPLDFPDVEGKVRTPLVVGDRKAVVLVFVSPYCPTSNAFTPEVNRIAANYGDRFAFYLVEADADITLADAKKHVETMEIKVPVLLDTQHRLALLTKAKTTPEAVVLNANGEPLYQGRINDLYSSQTRKLKEPKTHDLRVALDAIAAGQPVPVAATKAIGCSISGIP